MQQPGVVQMGSRSEATTQEFPIVVHLALTAAGASHVGLVRKLNEDQYHCGVDAGLFIVADGMGGLSRGDHASGTTIRNVVAAVAEGQSVSEGYRRAHRELAAMTVSRSRVRFGSTAVALHYRNDRALVVWLGDSRAYLWRNNALKQLTKDHSYVQKLVDAGAITPREALTHPNRNVITQAIGPEVESDVEPEQLVVALHADDRVLLCSDGLSSYLGDERMAAALRRGGSDAELVDRMVQQTLTSSAAEDNLTVICVSVLEL